ncbi:hypothetical protein GCM10009530_12150 [Microbispora corallina]|uniref:Uncharacterized protein n=1 Tax=Microbispora corallina TaxID=83302 RepID=A0ABQ4FTQ2_9ACTN|nr:hypothetical protein Mco01_10880 [Microbispora corallina]
MWSGRAGWSPVTPEGVGLVTKDASLGAAFVALDQAAHGVEPEHVEHAAAGAAQPVKAAARRAAA